MGSANYVQYRVVDKIQYYFTTPSPLKMQLQLLHWSQGELPKSSANHLLGVPEDWKTYVQWNGGLVGMESLLVFFYLKVSRT